METCYAIDFGTSNSLLGAVNPEQDFGQIPIGIEGEGIMKTILYAAESHQWFFGSQAIDEYLQQPTHGRIFKSLKKFLPDQSFQRTRVFQEVLTLPDLIAKFLRMMRERANTHLDQDVQRVMLGCPARFSDDPTSHELALDRLKAAAISAGFTEVSFCPEPIAAAYKFQPSLEKEQLVLIADFGGGTSDFTVQKMSQQPFQDKDVLAMTGLSVAGDKYDGAIMEHFVAPAFGSRAKYKRPTASNVSHFPKGFIRKLTSPADLIMMSKNSVLQNIRDAQRWLLDPDDEERLENLVLLIEDRMAYALFREIEQTKIELSDTAEGNFSFSYDPIDVRTQVTQDGFEDCSAKFTSEIIGCLDRCLIEAGLKSEQIDVVCLTGGTSQLPFIAKQLRTRFGDKLTTSSQFDSVVQGLGVRAQQWLRTGV